VTTPCCSSVQQGMQWPAQFCQDPSHLPWCPHTSAGSVPKATVLQLSGNCKQQQMYIIHFIKPNKVTTCGN
jgi:hypothetical protein